MGAGVRKPPKEETAGRKGRCVAGRALWGFEARGRLAFVAAVGGGARSLRRNRRRRTCLIAEMHGFGAGAAVGGGRATWQGQRSRAPARGWRRKRSTFRGKVRGDGHELSILIRFGDGDRAGRAPSNVSTMIIRPPQHGHRRAGEGALVSQSSEPQSACAGGTCGVASAWRTRSMLRARTVPANRP